MRNVAALAFFYYDLMMILDIFGHPAYAHIIMHLTAV